MANERGVIREIIWSDICPWLILPRAVRLAVSARVLILCALALVGVSAGWSVIGAVFQGTNDAVVQACVGTDERTGAYDRWTWSSLTADDWRGSDSTLRVSDTSAADPLSSAALRIPFLDEWLDQGAVPGAWAYLVDPFVRLITESNSAVSVAYLTLCCLWEALVWALFGGAVTRIAALDLARDERLGLFPAVTDQMRRWPSYFLAPILPLIGVLLVVLVLAIVGALMRMSLFVFIAGLLWFLVIFAGLFLAIVLIGLAAGWPMMWPTISTERTDAFDALSRSFAYVYQRPLYYLFLVVIAAVLGVLASVVVDIFVDGTIGFGNWAVEWGAGDVRWAEIEGWQSGNDAGWLGGGGASLMAFWQGCVAIVKPAFQVGFFWCAATAIYLLMRRAVDSTEMDEIVLDDDQESVGLPPLATDEQGVPGLDDDATGADVDEPDG